MNDAVMTAGKNGACTITAPGKSDFFIDPRTGTTYSNAPFCYERIQGDFVASVRVKPDFHKRYDAGGLFVYDKANRWIKLEYELTDLGYPSVVTVVTDKLSDDSNGERKDEVDSIWLQVVRRGSTWALHHSETGKKWKMVRFFQLPMKDEVKVGLVAQSPVGGGCSVGFSRLKIGTAEIADMRKGK
ncbi:MAG: DUF1349 domain-containing protein [Spirochaetota bacterium]